MNIFVTGGSGFLGQAFLSQLLAEPGSTAKIYVLSRSPLPDLITKNSRVEILRGDLKSLGQFANEIQSCEYVFHIAANASFAASALDAEADNVVPTQNLCRLVKSGSKIKTFIFISSIGAADRARGDLCQLPLTDRSVPSPRSDYGKSKLNAESAVRMSGLPFTILRPGWVYGENMRANSHLNKFVTMISCGSKVAHFNFPGKVSLIHVKDLAQAMIRVIGNTKIIGKTYFAVTEAIPLGEILATIGQKVSGDRPFQIPVFGLSFFISRLHHKLPIALNNLIVGYLWADEKPFLDEFALTHPQPFWSGVDDIVSTNARTGGKFLITGANSGIGLALAKKLVKMKRKVILVDKKTDALGDFKDHTVIYADFNSPEAVSDIVDKVKNERLAALINNAGVGFRKSLEESSPEDIRLTIQVNDVAPILLTQGLLRQLKRDGSTIINIGSSTAFNPLPGMSLYAASKALLVSWSEAISYELRATNTVITFSPSGTKTGFQKSAGVAVLNEGKGLQDPAEVAWKIISAFERNKKYILLGAPSRVLVLVSKFLPTSLKVKMWGILFAKMR